MFALWGVDINTVSLRRLACFVKQLPIESKTVSAFNQVTPEAQAWDVNTYMLANVIDMLNALDWHLVAANSKHVPPKPKPFPRPNLKKKKVLWPGKTIVDTSKENNNG